MATRSRLDFSKPHVLRTGDEYASAVREIDALLAEGAPKPGSEDADRLQLLSVLVEAYETEHEPPMPDVGPVELVRFMLEQHDMTRADLAPLMGGKARVSEFFSGPRSLSIAQLRRLSTTLRIPADLLIMPEPATQRRRKAASPNARSAGARPAAVAEPSPTKPRASKRPRGRR